MSETTSNTRDRLLEAARELFTTAGYHATTTPMLARHAGVAEGTIYRHFNSKQALLDATFQEIQEWGAAGIKEVAEGLGDTGSRLGRLGLRWLAAAETDPARMRMLLIWGMPGELSAISVEARQNCRAGIEQLVAVGKQEGTIRAGVVGLWAAVWLTLITMAVERVAAKEWTAGHPHALATIEVAWEAIAWRPIATPSRADDSTAEEGNNVPDHSTGS